MQKCKKGTFFGTPFRWDNNTSHTIKKLLGQLRTLELVHEQFLGRMDRETNGLTKSQYRWLHHLKMSAISIPRHLILQLHVPLLDNSLSAALRFVWTAVRFQVAAIKLFLIHRLFIRLFNAVPLFTGHFK